jgi:hypothetical protein
MILVIYLGKYQEMNIIILIFLNITNKYFDNTK